MRKWTYPYSEVLAEQVRKMNEIFRSLGRAEVRKAELQIFGSQGRPEVRKRTSPHEVPAEMKCGSGLTHTVRTSVEYKRDLSKSWPSGSTESGLQIFWQSRKSRRAEVELHIFGSPDRDEVDLHILFLVLWDQREYSEKSEINDWFRL